MKILIIFDFIITFLIYLLVNQTATFKDCFGFLVIKRFSLQFTTLISLVFMTILLLSLVIKLFTKFFQLVMYFIYPLT